jgi:hypothetical protein
VAAKVTRDACVDGWTFEELLEEDSGAASREDWNREFGSGYPSGLLYASAKNRLHAECNCRSEDPSLDKELCRPHFRFSFLSPFLMDDCESHIGEIGAFCKVVTRYLYRILTILTDSSSVFKDRRRAGIVNESVRRRKGEGQRSVHCHQGPWNSEYQNAIKSLHRRLGSK